MIECGAGLGMVLILRWYWWRINAWSEITASIAPFIGYFIANYLLALEYPFNFLFTVGFSTICWLIATFMTAPTDKKTLQHFYNKVKPDGGWSKFRKPEDPKTKLTPLFICWISSIVMVYSILFSIGDFIFLHFEDAVLEFSIAIISFLLLRFQLKRTRIFEI
jgi:hypothetical protein